MSSRRNSRRPKQGAITVYALNGKAVQTITALSGFGKGMAALDKHHAGSK